MRVITGTPYEWPSDSQQRPNEPGRMNNDEHFQVFLESVGQNEIRTFIILLHFTALFS